MLEKVLEKNGLFGVLPQSIREELARQGTTLVEANKTVDVECGIGIIVSGCVDVMRGEDDRVVFNRIKSGGVFGMARLFGSNEDKKSKISIITRTECELFTVSGEKVVELIKTYPDFSIAYISLLSDKIRFLSGRVREFSSDTIENRVLCFLTANNGCRCSMVELTKRLGIGRASLYRAIDALEEKGLIIKNGKDITVLENKGKWED